MVDGEFGWVGAWRRWRTRSGPRGYVPRHSGSRNSDRHGGRRQHRCLYGCPLVFGEKHHYGHAKGQGVVQENDPVGSSAAGPDLSHHVDVLRQRFQPNHPRDLRGRLHRGPVDTVLYAYHRHFSQLRADTHSRDTVALCSC
uniref:(northern house mosquito) hypothetical protein n=1 Tax=Culex pipiens TaxID=7175 RepID=A0A8D8G3G7_CULPI